MTFNQSNRKRLLTTCLSILIWFINNCSIHANLSDRTIYK